MAATNVKKGGIIFTAALLWNPKDLARARVLILASRAAKGSVSRDVKITAISGLSRSRIDFSRLSTLLGCVQDLRYSTIDRKNDAEWKLQSDSPLFI